MNKNTITGLIIIFAILIGYSIWMTPSDEEKEATNKIQSIKLPGSKRLLYHKHRIQLFSAV
jgi:hypothetical protein